MITTRELTSNNYEKYEAFGQATALWRKAFRDDFGIKYYLIFYQYTAGFEAEGQFIAEDIKFRILLSPQSQYTVESVERWFNARWYANRCEYYEEFDV
jgi:hypothetical protein